MRKLLSFVCICALACGLFACGKGEAYTPRFNNDSVPIDAKSVATSGRVTDQGFLRLWERCRC